MKEKKLVPKKRFVGYMDEWEIYKLKEVVAIENGYAFKSKYFKTDTTREIVITPGNVNIGGGFQDGKGHYYDISGKFPTKSIMKPGDIFVTMTDLTSSAQVLGFPALIPNDGNIYLHNQRLGKLINYDLNKDYLFNLLCTERYHRQIVMTASGTTVKHSSPQRILNSLAGIPSIEEQQKIGNFFKHLDRMIFLEQRKLEKTKALKAAYLVEMFPAERERVPKRRFTGFKKDWQETILGELGITFSGMSGKTKKDFGHGDAEFVTYMNVFKNEISDTLLTEKVVLDNRQSEVKYGDVFFTTSSETPHEVGMSSMWLDNRPNVYLNSFCFGFRPASEINKLYLAYLLRSNEVRNQIEILAQGISRYNISKRKVMEITIYIPDYEEQKEIGEFFKKIDDTISNQQKKLNKLKAMKQAYLEEMFV